MAISAGMVWEVRNGGSDTACGGGFRGGAALSTPPAPGVSAITTGGSVAANTYYVVVTETDGNGETPKSAESSVTTTGATSTITVTAPTNPNVQGSTWNIYVGTASGGPYFSQSTGNAFGSNKSITTTPPTSGTQAPGVDYSQQASAQLVINNTTVTCTTTGANSNTLTFTAGYTPSAADVGNTVRLTGGTNINVGTYEITGWSSTTWTLAGAANATTAGGAGSAVTGDMGGALATPGMAGSLMVAQNKVFLQYNATAYTASGSLNVAGGGISLAGGSSSGNLGYLVGYNTTRTVNNTDASRPTIDASANSATLARTGSYGVVTNVNFDNTLGKTGVTGIIVNGFGSQARNCRVKNASGTGIGVSLTTGGGQAFDCEANACGVGFQFSGSGTLASGCVATSCTATGFKNNQVSGFAVCTRCLAVNTTGDGFTNNVQSGSFLLEDCSAYNSSVINFKLLAGSVARNCVAYGAGSTDYTTGGLGTGGASTVLLVNCAGVTLDSALQAANLQNFITLSANPFTSTGGNDYSLNTTAGGGALLRGLGVPASYPGLSTTSYPDVGAAQHADPVTVAGGPPGGVRVFAPGNYLVG